nr:ABC transporter ATP-binding protein [Agrobacterium sp. a22-2]
MRDIGKRYRVGQRDVTALSGIDLSLSRGSFTTVVGRSGCGKTTLLRILAGLTEPSHGTMMTSGAGEKLKVGVVFQEPRLMPWLTVFDNIAFGLKGRHDGPAIEARCGAILDLVGLRPFRDALPTQLSGGMAQRVALARALVLEPDLLLLDEPFAALDAFTRRSMQNELIAIWQKRGATVVFVTHDVEEAVVLGQTVVELAHGRMAGQDRVDLPYPRDPTDALVGTHRRAILDRLLSQVSGAPNAGDCSTPTPES